MDTSVRAPASFTKACQIYSILVQEQARPEDPAAPRN